MFFGDKSFQKAQRGVPSSLKRQLLLLVALLAGVALIGIQFLSVVNRQRTQLPGPPSGEEERGSFGTSGSDLGPPREPEPPEPFEKKPEVLNRGLAADRTTKCDEKLLSYLLQKVRTQAAALEEDEAVLSLAREEDDVWKELMESPHEYRGELVELEGEVLSPEPGRRPLHLRGLDFPNPSGLDRAFQSYMVGTDSKFYMVATAAKERELAHRDAVKLRGYFCQLYSYPVELDGRLRTATIPFVVGADYEPLPRPAVESPWSGEHLPLLGALAAFAFVAIVLLRRRSARSFEERRRAARAGVRPPPAGAACKCGDPRCRGECGQGS